MPRLARWFPFFGAVPAGDGTRFRVWAPGARELSVVVETGAARGEHPLAPEPDDTFAAVVAGARAGDRYRLRKDGGPPMPDPASRFQPEGVHGPSEIVDPAAFVWRDAGWRGMPPAELVLYELHVGTFTPEGTFEAAAARLPYLRDLGVTAVELMPVADFPGRRNWGYDPAALFAPARCYGRPDDLRRLVDAAHSLGLAVHLDVVYNHLGPDGAYLAAFSPPFFTDRHRSPWGAGVNLDGPGSAMVRRFLVENALHWLHEYHIDGLRLDATHALADDSPRHFLAELAGAVHATARAWPALVVAEDSRNLAILVREPAEGGWGLDGVWADDFHHVVRVMLAGDRDGYYADYEGTIAELATTLRDGWLYQGRMSRYLGRPRGTDPRGVPKRKFVIAIQNHDQVGNRAFGDRLHHAVDPAAYRAASALLLLAPETPLLFMGQEWAATTPFLYFTDHGPELGARVADGRRKEFARFAAFQDEAARARIPDPQAESTFLASRLRWEEIERPPHRGVLELYRRLLALRRTLLSEAAREGVAIGAAGEDAISVRYAGGPDRLALVVRLRGAGPVRLDDVGEEHEVLLTTEDPDVAPDPQPPRIAGGRTPAIDFARPGAVVLRVIR